jgi:hypothetical protein
MRFSGLSICAAKTYDQLGAVAQEQHRLAETEGCWKQGLEIYIASEDNRSATIVRLSFARFWKRSSPIPRWRSSQRCCTLIYSEEREILKKALG